MCDCQHDPRFHDRNGCLAWAYPATEDRRRNPRKCRCKRSMSDKPSVADLPKVLMLSGIRR